MSCLYLILSLCGLNKAQNIMLILQNTISTVLLNFKRVKFQLFGMHTTSSLESWIGSGFYTVSSMTGGGEEGNGL